MILAHANGGRSQRKSQRFNEIIQLHSKTSNFIEPLAHIAREPIKPSSGELRKGDGVPFWLDRIKSLGNAVVPQLVFEIFKIIEAFDIEVYGSKIIKK